MLFLETSKVIMHLLLIICINIQSCITKELTCLSNTIILQVLISAAGNKRLVKNHRLPPSVNVNTDASRIDLIRSTSINLLSREIKEKIFKCQAIPLETILFLLHNICNSWSYQGSKSDGSWGGNRFCSCNFIHYRQGKCVNAYFNLVEYIRNILGI